jgi:nucleoside-diphosphate-sugar epimerase
LNKLSGKRVVVTGASGYLGAHLCHRLDEIGADVYSVSRTAPSKTQKSAQWVAADLSDFSKARNILFNIKPDVIFHLAGLSSAARELQLVLPTFHCNLATSVNLFTLATETGCSKIILPGSFEEPDLTGIEVIPSSPYAASKWATSAYANMFYRLYNTPITRIRLFMVYGPGKQNQKKLIPYVINSYLKNTSPKITNGNREIDWIYISDVIDAMIAVAGENNTEGCTIDVGSGNTISIKKLVGLIADFMNPNLKPSFGELPERPLEQNGRAEIRKTFAKIQWKPVVSMENGIKNTIEWFRKNQSP